VDLREWVGEYAPYLLVINKIDLQNDPNSNEQLRLELSTKYDTSVFMTSAKTGQNISVLFEAVENLLWTMA
jgi:GTPase Era involved in 16S rRNA processing